MFQASHILCIASYIDKLGYSIYAVEGIKSDRLLDACLLNLLLVVALYAVIK
jgi:hypothetical protein